MTVRELIRLLRADGWERVGRRGGVEQWRHLWKPRRATIAGRPGEELGRAAALHVLRHVGLEGTAAATAAGAPRRASLTPAVERRDEVSGPARAGGTQLVRLGS